MKVHHKPETEAGRILEEIANSVTHGVGLALSIAGLAVLVALASLRGGARHVLSCSIYGGTLVLLYAISTFYHSVRQPKVKHVFRVLDHSAIYLLIAGTYTPFSLVSLWGPWGWTLLGLIWVLAVAGITFKAVHGFRYPKASAVVYVLMGWLAVVAIKPMLASIPLGGVEWLIAGGLAYTLGLAFFMWERMPYHHAVWHLFVMAGSICHYFAVVFYVVPRRA